MHAVTHVFAVAMVSLAGTAAVLALARLVLVQVRGVTRLSRQLNDPADGPRSSWEFADCASPPGWLLLPPERHTGHLERWQR